MLRKVLESLFYYLRTGRGHKLHAGGAHHSGRGGTHRGDRAENQLQDPDCETLKNRIEKKN